VTLQSLTFQDLNLSVLLCFYLELRSLIAAWSLAETTVDLGSPIGRLLMLTLPTSSN